MCRLDGLQHRKPYHAQQQNRRARLAGAWAMFNYFGEQGYIELAQNHRHHPTRLAEGINAHPGLRV